MTMARNGRFPGGYYSSSVMNGGESEGSGSSGRDDMEITASEDSSIPGRKCISLNSNKQDIFGVPTQVLPVAGISPAQRKDLVLRLRAELEQIRNLQKKVELQRTNGATFSSSSDILSGSNRQNGNRIENFRKSSMMNSGPGKILNSQSHKARGWNRGTSGRFETAREAPVQSSACLLLMRQCEALLKRLMSHQFGWVFNNPVDVVKLNLPDYFTVIKHPMDLGTIKSKLASGVYFSPLEFLADVRLTFSNAMTYNPRGNDVHFMADSMSKFFEARWKSIEKKIPVSDCQIVPENSGIRDGSETAKRMPPSKRRKITPLQHPVIPEPIVERIMTDEEKHNLGRELESLLADMPAHIVDFLREHSSNGRETVEDEIEIDIDEFSDDTLFALRKLLDDYMEEKQKNHARAEPCEIELLNESGLSNSSMQPCKGNDPVDEDVDIGGNEPPVSSYPPVEIEKDSDSSSDSDADGAKASTPVNVTKVLDPVETEAQPDGKISVGDQIEGTQSVSGLDQVEVQQMPTSVESDDCQDGDSAPTERQVSPEKLYRAALLKNRFADTILKAREKTLKQGEKGDPEKLRREKEQLEIQRRKEKARLQAEAKAAEDARRRAEVEAAAEAKRKRELEREAARQALLQMEKTVEINETSRFLKDLEMLRAAPVEPLPISIDERSPDHSQDGMSGFKFGGSNPLEQLGLYMKEDDEEEEGEPPSVPNPLEQLGLYMRTDNEDEECGPPSIPNPLEQLGLYMKNDEDEEEGELLTAPNTLEELGLYMKKNEEEEDGVPPSDPKPLEQVGLYMKNDEDKEEDELRTAPSTLEQLGLYMKKDGEEEDVGPPTVPNPLEQLGLSMKKNEEEDGEPPSDPKPLEQLGLYMKKDEEEEGELPSLSSPLEQNGSYMKKNGDEEEGVSNPLEQDEVQMKKDEEEGGAPSSVPHPSEQLGLSMKKDDEEERVPPSVPNLTNDVEEGEID